MFSTVLPCKNTTPKIRIVWIHGWGGSHEGMLTLANFFADDCECVLLDLDGFGRSPEPKEAMNSTDYANAVFDILDKMPKRKNIIAGFSYGGRIALRMALQQPDNVDGLVLLAAAGLVRKRSPAFKIKSFLGKNIGKLIRKFPTLAFLRKLAHPSRDYANSSDIMKETLKMSLAEDLGKEVHNISCPALLIYGDKDTETPPYFGDTYKALIKDSYLKKLPFDTHLSVLESELAIDAIAHFIDTRF